MPKSVEHAVWRRLAKRRGCLCRTTLLQRTARARRACQRKGKKPSSAFVPTGCAPQENAVGRVLRRTHKLPPMSPYAKGQRAEVVTYFSELGQKLVTDLSTKPRFRKNRRKAEYKALAFCKKCGIMCILFNMGVFQDSPGVEGDSISVPQRLLRTKAKLN